MAIDPSEQSVIVYFPQQKPAFLAVTTDILPIPEFANIFQLTLGELFGWLSK
jgi:Uma2 family endonuclease